MPIDPLLYEPHTAEGAAAALKKSEMTLTQVYVDVRTNSMLAWNVHTALQHHISQALPTFSKRQAHEQAAKLMLAIYQVDMSKNTIYANLVVQLSKMDNLAAGGH